jgi:hypothetical protein
MAADGDAPDEVTRSCNRCGSLATCAADGIPAGWSMAIEGRGAQARVEYLCAACLRANVRSIEAKLPGEYWE